MSDDLQARLDRLAESERRAWARANELDAEVRRLSDDLRRVWEHAEMLDTALQAYVTLLGKASYNADALAVWDKAVPFLDDARFRAAYRHGMDSGHHICRAVGSQDDIHIEWRVHVVCWAASQAARLPGDFVECGVNTGIYSLAVCDYLDFNRLDKKFFLFDTFNGLPVSHMLDQEREVRLVEQAHLYSECYDLARTNFAPFPRAQLVPGTVPETLDTVAIDQVAYLSIDMNLVMPERAAIEWFWPKLVPGAPVILDDYGWEFCPLQRQSMDEFFGRQGVEILTLPTGQGLVIKS